MDLPGLQIFGKMMEDELSATNPKQNAMICGHNAEESCEEKINAIGLPWTTWPQPLEIAPALKMTRGTQTKDRADRGIVENRCGITT